MDFKAKTLSTDDVIGVKCDLDLTRYRKECGKFPPSEIDERMENNEPFTIQGLIANIKIMTYKPFSPLLFKVIFVPLKSEYEKIAEIMGKFKINKDEMIEILMGESTHIDDFVFSYGDKKHFEELKI